MTIGNTVSNFSAELVCIVLIMTGTACSPAVRATLYYQGERIDRVVQEQPLFSGPKGAGRITYRQGEFVIDKLDPGSHDMLVQIDADKSNPLGFAGDYYGWFQFGTVKDVQALLNINMNRIIHLVKPVDNAKLIEKTGSSCDDVITLERPATFEWEPLGEEVYYDYEVVRVVCPYKQAEIISYGTSTQTRLALALPRNGNKEFYRMRLHARKEGRPVGMLMLQGTDRSTSWDYRFRLAE